MNPFKQRLAAGEPALGILLSMPSPQLAQTLAACGLDWLFIDMEHGPIDFADAHALIAATQGTACAPLVRVPSDNLAAARPVLDAGAFGLIVPMVRTAQQARDAMAYLRYPPAGERGVGPLYAPQRWGLSMADYLRAANEQLAAVVLIEHIDAVRNLDAILAVPGIDVALIAPYDLSASMGRPGDLQHPDVAGAIAQAERTILAGTAALGGLAQSPEDAKAKLDAGYRTILMGIDVFLIQQTVAGLLKAVGR
ncbi:MAG TPA: aldolase/citrate lyase family protein [bacterium]|nr:aldolase/citrate lyase family protein [bacterium]